MGLKTQKQKKNLKSFVVDETSKLNFESFFIQHSTQSKKGIKLDGFHLNNTLNALATIPTST